MTELRIPPQTTLTPAQVLDIARLRLGFLDDTEIAVLAADPTHRLTLVLVRCGRSRFVAPAQDVAHLISIIAADPEHRDYVRDCSLWTPPATGASWRSGR